MHELAIMQNVVSVCEREAEKHGFKRVKTIALAVGAVSGIVPECMFEFFPAASKHKGIAAFQADGQPMARGTFEQDRIDLLLLCRVRTRALADKDLFAVCPHERKQILVEQTVVDHTITAAQQFRAAQGERSRAAPRAYQRHAVHNNASRRAVNVCAPS